MLRIDSLVSRAACLPGDRAAGGGPAARQPGCALLPALAAAHDGGLRAGDGRGRPARVERATSCTPHPSPLRLLIGRLTLRISHQGGFSFDYTYFEQQLPVASQYVPAQSPLPRASRARERLPSRVLVSASPHAAGTRSGRAGAPYCTGCTRPTAGARAEGRASSTTGSRITRGGRGCGRRAARAARDPSAALRSHRCITAGGVVTGTPSL